MVSFFNVRRLVLLSLSLVSFSGMGTLFVPIQVGDITIIIPLDDPSEAPLDNPVPPSSEDGPPSQGDSSNSVNWSSSNVVVGREVSLTNLNSSVVRCNAENQDNVSANIVGGKAIFYVSSSEIGRWQCFDSQNNIIHDFESNLRIIKLNSPSQVEAIIN